MSIPASLAGTQAPNAGTVGTPAQPAVAQVAPQLNDSDVQSESEANRQTIEGDRHLNARIHELEQNIVIADLERRLEAQSQALAPVAPAEPVGQSAAVQHAPVREQEETRNQGVSFWKWILLGIGVIVLLAGIAFAVSSFRDSSDPKMQLRKAMKELRMTATASPGTTQVNEITKETVRQGKLLPYYIDKVDLSDHISGLSAGTRLVRYVDTKKPIWVDKLPVAEEVSTPGLVWLLLDPRTLTSGMSGSSKTYYEARIAEFPNDMILAVEQK